VRDYRGVKIIDHGGAIFGVQTYIVLVPSRNLGIAVQMNAEDFQVMRAIANELLDHYLGDGGQDTDWMVAFDDFANTRIAGGVAALDATEKANAAGAGKASLPIASYAGQYKDAWYGPLDITQDKGALRINFTRTPGMTGRLEHWQHDTFRTVWDDKSLEPAYVTFGLDAEGKVDRITLKAVSPIADFSYDYQDLLFAPVPAKQ
jgi:hypothetical protein